MNKKTFVAVLAIAVLFLNLTGTLTAKAKASAPNNLGLTLKLPSSFVYAANSSSAVLPLTIIVNNPYSQYYFLTNLYDLEISLDGKVLSGYPNVKEVNERTTAEWKVNLTLNNLAVGAHNLTVYVAADFTYQGYGIIPVGPPPEDFSDGSATSTASFNIINPTPSPSLTTPTTQTLSPSPSQTQEPTPSPSVPEFPNWIIIPLMAIAATMIVYFKRIKLRMER